MLREVLTPPSSLGLPWLPHAIELRCEGAPAQERRQGHGDTPAEAGRHHDRHQPPLVLPHGGILQYLTQPVECQHGRGKVQCNINKKRC